MARRITTLLFRGPGSEHTVPGWCAFGEYIEAMEKTMPDSTFALCQPILAFIRWGVGFGP
jgi:hypothetical protein